MWGELVAFLSAVWTVLIEVLGEMLRQGPLVRVGPGDLVAG